MKRAFDFISAVIIIIFLSPLILIFSVLIKMNLGSPILFKQERPGYQGKLFTFYKFRSMTNETDDNGELLPNSKRLTRFGKFLRKTSMDELPQLINVIKGDLSLVGPRPLLVEYLDMYTGEQARRHDVRPGITGLAQINGRADILWEDKFKFDVWYVDNRTFWLDIKILFATLVKVFKNEGVSVDGVAKEKFNQTGR